MKAGGLGCFTLPGLNAASVRSQVTQRFCGIQVSFSNLQQCSSRGKVKCKDSKAVIHISATPLLSQLPAKILWEPRDEVQLLGCLSPKERPRQSSWLLALAWCSSGFFRHLGSKPVVLEEFSVILSFR